jgi:hypothetical protein
LKFLPHDPEAHELDRRLRLIRHPLPILLPSLCWLFISCGTNPLPDDKLVYVGQWKAQSGFMLEIRADGTADISQLVSPSNPEYGRLCIKVGPPEIRGLNVDFQGEKVLEVALSMKYGKTYTIDRPPYREGNGMQMVLNGITLTKR